MTARILPIRGKALPPAPFDPAAQWREDARRIDWTRVHLEGDRNPPIFVRLRRWAFSAPHAGMRGGHMIPRADDTPRSSAPPAAPVSFPGAAGSTLAERRT